MDEDMSVDPEDEDAALYRTPGQPQAGAMRPWPGLLAGQLRLRHARADRCHTGWTRRVCGSEKSGKQGFNTDFAEKKVKPRIHTEKLE
jgi:hypothetical protein